MSSSISSALAKLPSADRTIECLKSNAPAYAVGLATPLIVNTAVAATSGASGLVTAGVGSLYTAGYLGLAIGCPTTLAAVTGIGYLCRQIGKRPAFKEHGRNIIHQLKSSPGITDATRIALDTIKPVAAGKIAIKMETQNRKRDNSEIPSNLDVLRRINPRLANILEREISEASCELVETIPADPAPATVAASPAPSCTLPSSDSGGFYTYTMP